MIPFTSPEIQLDLIREHNQDLVREAARYRLARQFRLPRTRRFGRWPRGRRPDRAARQSLAS